jgi:cellobiose phosphorylase
MDFPTRDRYRHSVEELAKNAKKPEPDVARRAVTLAEEAVRSAPTHDRSHHVGYYLISRGRFALEEEVGYSPTVRDRMTRFTFRHPVFGYLGIIGLVVALSMGSLLSYASRHGATSFELALVAIVSLLPIAELAIGLLNLLVTSQVPPRQLPKLDMRDGVPESDRTMVVVPAIVESEARLLSLLDELEVRFFANRDAHVHFALLTDFGDADTPTTSTDEAIVEAARNGIERLNELHGADRFFLFHRVRRWNEGERRWMGWERKRGKLMEFNRLLRGATDTSFTIRQGDLSVLPTVRYVITLDSDTQLPMETARRLVGTLSHPLNRPRFDAHLQRVTEGYGVLQPRVAVSVVSANRTVFSKVFSGHVGIDPYTTAVSDVYQDLFHEGSYVGKGIYDVDAFEAALAGRVPENTLLSHDLFEGSYARAALCTDIHLVDDYPSHYLTFAARLHRWVRGDWQIARWLWRTVPDEKNRPVANTLPIIARWKIADNLRRSLMPPAIVALFVTGWTCLPGYAVFWTTMALLVLAFPAYIQVGRALGSRAAGVPLREHLRAEADNIVTSLRQAAFSIIMLAHQSVVMLDAIGRVLVRLTVTRRGLLEWVTADRAATSDASFQAVLRKMWLAPVLAVALAVVVAFVSPRSMMLAAPILLLWFISPIVAYSFSRPLTHRRAPVTQAERTTLRVLARQTWRFFEELIGPGDNWLIPDNYQQNRKDVIAHRTSPTNIGLQLLSTVAAFDFGYLGVTDLFDRLEPTFDSLLRMSRYRGHFFNWYDTTTLAPLAPAYISTVDSGNLAGYLLTLRSSLTQIVESTPIVTGSTLEGIGDALKLFESELEGVGKGSYRTRVRKELDAIRNDLASRPMGLAAWTALLVRLRERIESLGVTLHEIEEAVAPDANPGPGEAAYWLERAEKAVIDRQTELESLAGWTASIDAARAARIPSFVPSLADIVRWTNVALSASSSEPLGDSLRDAIEAARIAAEEAIDRAERLSELADDLLEEVEFGFLFDSDRQLFSIGYSVADGRLDGSYYDMLASEARLASFVAIATHKISHEHWFKLGRSLTPSGTSRALLSWSASMFEYLMPLLVMRNYPGTLLDETYEAVVERQIHYGDKRGVPWGISESAYNLQDLEGNYQYRAFGVPGLGLKRGLAEDLVIAPYATVLAAPLVPSEVVRNLERLRAEGLAGRYGYFEAIDYTPERLPANSSAGVPLPTYMAHHQGMSLIALDNLLNGLPMQNRFHADPRIQAAELLLQERIPQLVPLKNPPIETADHVPQSRRGAMPAVRRYTTPNTLSPRAHLLSNGSYCLMVTNAGGGYSRRHQLALTRWRPDITSDDWGSFCYVRDVDRREVWSTTHHPTGREADEYEVIFANDRAMFRRIDGEVETRTEIVVSPEDDAELRRVSITNHSLRSRNIELTSYAEVVLAPPEADLAHPAFSNLFVETRPIVDRDALLCTRRPRAGTERAYLVHVLTGRGRVGLPTQYETDRARFIGRGGSLARPDALFVSDKLSNTTGAVLDPIVSLRHTIRLPPGGTARVTFTTGYADDEAGAMRLIEKYHDRRAVARALALAGTHGQIEMRHFGLSVDDMIRFQRLGSRMLYGDPRLRSAESIQRSRRGQSALWKYGISGDVPIALARFPSDADLGLFQELLRAHEYLRVKGFAFDLVVLNEQGVSYRQDLQNALQQMLESSPERAWADRPGGVFLRRIDLLPPEDQLLLAASARVVMDGSQGNLEQQLVRPTNPVADMVPTWAARAPEPPPREGAEAPPPQPDLQAFNGLGGFGDNGREYVIEVEQRRGAVPPAPWSNVVAHATFGFVASELGPGFTWSENSHENRLTPWRNDPVRDPPGEALFIRDEESGRVWSATPLPAGDGLPYTVRHTPGSTSYEHARDGIESTLTVSIAPDAPVKLFTLKVRNSSGRLRRLSATLYVDWVLGDDRARTQLHIVTDREPATGAVMATNAFRDAFAERVAFVDIFPGERTVTADRTEFIGRNGSLQSPAGLASAGGLSGRVGAAFDQCGAVQVAFSLDTLSERIIVGQLGEGRDPAGVRALVERFRADGAADTAVRQTRSFWDTLTNAVQVETPDAAMNLMLNRWLLYQTLSCRIWGRSAFYQSSGAFGFRDQLQDVLALLFASPDTARAHLLHAASRQFVEGDVQHWWHEPEGQGVRTKFSDDRLWLVYATLHYVRGTGDDSVLDEQVPFLEGRVLTADEHEVYERPARSRQSASLYEHCVRAVALNLQNGAHGLPLMGSGDWNDGMNLVGAGGRGESVWLGWFFASLLGPFADLAESRGERDRAAAYRRHASSLADALDAAWDGEWYRRAYFDDGTPLGSASNTECRIDAIAQSWAVISGRAKPERARQAMASTDTQLIRRAEKLILLLTPPFDTSSPSPGYIQGYVPGVRENGGQYTHAALWTVLAFAMLGDGDAATELFALINPVNHASSQESLQRYRVEPYVVAADVYSQPPHTSRGGWTWYTGSAGWMYRVGMEAILGLSLERGALRVDPCIPKAWPGYKLTFRSRNAEYQIAVDNPDGVNRGVRSVDVDGRMRPDGLIPIIDDGGVHHVRVVLGA